MLNEISQIQKDEYYMIYLYYTMEVTKGEEVEVERRVNF